MAVKAKPQSAQEIRRAIGIVRVSRMEDVKASLSSVPRSNAIASKRPASATGYFSLTC